LKRTPLKKYKWKQTEAQGKYHDEHPNCEICGQPAMPTPHHIDHIHKHDEEENFFSLCGKHHVNGQNCPHRGSELLFIERNNLCEHPKWKAQYEKLKSKQEYQAKIKKVWQKPPHNID